MASLVCLCFVTVSVLFHTCWAGSCDKAAIKECLHPSVSYLQHNNMGQSKKGLFLTTLEHFLMTLDDSHENYIHISSLNTVLTNIDEALLHPRQLQEACRTFANTEKCVKGAKEWCDGEVRHQLEGLEDTMNYMCLEDKIKVYRAHYLCLTRNTKLNSVRKDCSQRLELGLHQVGQPSPVTRPTQETGLDLGGYKDALLYTTGIHIPTQGVSEDEIKHLSRAVCGLVNTALICYHSSVETTCQSEAAEWTTRLRHTLVHLLLVDLQCEDYDSGYRYKDLYKEEVCFQCTGNQSDCIDVSLKCNSVDDCEDGSDEDKELCDKHKSVNIAAILIGLSIAAFVVIVIIVCMVKHKRNADYDSRLAKDKFSTEMLSIANEEVSLGESTPPAPSGGRKFIYQAVGNGNAARA